MTPGQRFVFRIGATVAWLQRQGSAVATRVGFTAFAAVVGTFLLWNAGLLTTVLTGGGIFARAALGLAFGALAFALGAAIRYDRHGDIPTTRNAVAWLEWCSSAVVTLGFLGTLVGAIIELTSINPNAQGAEVLTMLGGVIRGVGVAVYATLAGTAAGLVVTVVAKQLQNAAEKRAELLEERARVAKAQTIGCVPEPVLGEDMIFGGLVIDTEFEVIAPKPCAEQPLGESEPCVIGTEPVSYADRGPAPRRGG